MYCGSCSHCCKPPPPNLQEHKAPLNLQSCRSPFFHGDSPTIFHPPVIPDSEIPYLEQAISKSKLEADISPFFFFFLFCFLYLSSSIRCSLVSDIQPFGLGSYPRLNISLLYVLFLTYLRTLPPYLLASVILKPTLHALGCRAFLFGAGKEFGG